MTSIKLKTPKGTCDYLPNNMEVRQESFAKIRSVFRLYGGEEIDTPVFELRDTLIGEYGKDSEKLIYNLEDQGGELLSLRYDLTIPFARFLAINRIQKMKRFQIGKVYRRDQPSKGRFREFYQCDFDIAGVYAPMMPDAEILSLLVESLTTLNIPEFVIKLNYRGLLDAILKISGVEEMNYKTVCSSIDKLDKETWDSVRKELIEIKEIPEKVVDSLGELIKAPFENLKNRSESLGENFTKALIELEPLLQYLEAYGIMRYISIDMSLARGLDYYTGIMFEVVIPSMKTIGSIAAGGRYDNLLGNNIPCIGMSLGFERIMTLLTVKKTTTPVKVFVGAFPSEKNMDCERIRFLTILRKNGISSEIMMMNSPKLIKELNMAGDKNIQYMIILTNDKDTVKIKNLITKTQEDVNKSDIIDYIQK